MVSTLSVVCSATTGGTQISLRPSNIAAHLKRKAHTNTHIVHMQKMFNLPQAGTDSGTDLERVFVFVGVFVHTKNMFSLP